MEMQGEIRKFTWRIENFSTITCKELYSEAFIVDGNKWQILIYPEGDSDMSMDYLSLYLQVADHDTLPSGWSRFAHFGLVVIDQNDRKTSVTKVDRRTFKASKPAWGRAAFLPLSKLHDPKRGYLVNDTFLVEAYVSSDRTKGLISRELIVENDWSKRKTKDADCVKAAIDNQNNTAIESEELSKKDMKTFFTSLESEFSSSNIVYAKEEAKEALAKVDEALNMTPVHFYDSRKFSPLKQAFKILDSFGCSSTTTLTIEQKSELLAMKGRLKEIACRAAKAELDKNLHTAKESIKLTVHQNLECSLIRFKQVEQKLAALDEHVEEAQKRREDMLAEQKGIFRSCKKLKKEMETLAKELAEFEADTMLAEEEEKTVKNEWKKMKDFISSIKGKI